MASRRLALRCVARRTNGEPCGNFAMVGCRVCHAHGGRAPQVRNAARRRLAMAEVHTVLTRVRAERSAIDDALRPWAGELSGLRWDAGLDLEPPEVLARRARVMARAMEEAARTLRCYARNMLTHHDSRQEGL